MVETELKFQIPAVRRAAVMRAVGTARATTLAMRAFYVDTPDRRLAAAGLALRLRLEGRRWVQTVKGRGDGMFSRLEHEMVVARPAAGQQPVIDPALHDGTVAGDALRAALDDRGESLQVLFETDVRRTQRVVRSGKSMIELALDVGTLRAGNAQAPICELEFELLRGDLVDATALAARWVDRFDLWLDIRSKAQRGDQLARGAAAGPVVAASVSGVLPAQSPDAALRGIVADCLRHLLPNAAEVGAGCAQIEHLHQLRVAMRRLRSGLRVFGAWSPAVEPGWQSTLAAAFNELGAARDRDMLAESLLPALRAAGAPLAELPPSVAIDRPGDAIRSRAWNRLLLDLVTFANGAAGPGDQTAPRRGVRRLAQERATLADQVTPLLKRMRRRLEKDAKQFVLLDAAARHQARKRLKRLRYSIEFVAPLFPPKATSRYLVVVRKAQDAIGLLHDVTVADVLFRELVSRDPRAWFAIGWLAARRAELLPAAADALAALAAEPPCWRRR